MWCYKIITFLWLVQSKILKKKQYTITERKSSLKQETCNGDEDVMLENMFKKDEEDLVYPVNADPISTTETDERHISIMEKLVCSLSLCLL